MVAGVSQVHIHEVVQVDVAVADAAADNPALHVHVRPGDERGKSNEKCWSILKGTVVASTDATTTSSNTASTVT
jgi:hypothetical protein